MVWRILAGTLEHHWKNLVETTPRWNATGETLTIAAYTGALLEGMQRSTHIQAHIVDQSSIHASLKWQDGGTSSSKWTGLWQFSFYLLLCSGYRFCSSNVWGIEHHSLEALYIRHIIGFAYLGLQFKWNQLSSNNCRITSCIHKGLHAGKWWPSSQILSVYRDTTGQTTMEQHWLILSPSGLPVAIQRLSFS